MKKLLLRLLLVSLLWSCNKDNSHVIYQKVKFEIGAATPTGRASTEISPDRVLINVEDSEGVEILTDESIPLVSFGNGFITTSLELPIGDYSLTSFMVIDEFDQVIYVTPIEGSAKSYLVSEPLPLQFSLTEGEVATVTPEVLALFEETDPDPGEFGYAAFSFEIVDVFVLGLATILDTDSSYLSTSVAITGYNSNDEVVLETVLLTDSATSSPLDLLSALEYYTFDISEDGYHPVSLVYQKSDLSQAKVLPIVLSSETETIAIEVSDTFTQLTSEEQRIVIYFSSDGCQQNFRVDFGGLQITDFQFIEILQSTMDSASNDVNEVFFDTLGPGTYTYGSIQNPEDLCESNPAEDLQILKSVNFEYGYRRLDFYAGWDVSTGLWTAEQIVRNSLDLNEEFFHETYDLDN